MGLTHYRDCSSNAIPSRDATDRRKVVGYIPELEGMEEMQAWAIRIGSINLWTHHLPW